MKYVLIIMLSLLMLNCNEKKSKVVVAADIINEAIEVSGVKKLDSSVIEFIFRDIRYKAVRNNGNFMLARVMVQDGDSIFDLLSNNGFERIVTDSSVKVPDSMATKYSSSVNSVHYFAVLPNGLDGKAVNKTYLEEVDIKGKTYHKIKVTFNEEGGGEDFEDVFIYWVNTNTKKVDYLAYSYKEDDGIGLRFREAYNERFISSIRFVDYNNYKPKEANVKLQDLDQLFVENKLELLSKIELEDVRVN